jgi:signal transduction histidine kinase/PAS domain-containing protein/ActR/RegA family two-component response regulator
MSDDGRSNPFERELTDAIPTGMGVFDLVNGQVIVRYLNEGYYQMAHELRSEHGYLEKHVLEALHPDDRKPFLKEGYDSIKENRPFFLRIRVLSKDMGYLWVSARASHVTLPDQSERFYAIFDDIDSMVKERQELLQTNQLYENAVQEGNLTLWEYDLKTNKVTLAKDPGTQYNASPYALPNVFAPEALIPIIEDTCVSDYLDLFKKVRQGEASASTEIWLKPTETLARRCDRISLVTAFNGDGDPIGAKGIGQNITEAVIKSTVVNRLTEKNYDYIGILHVSDGTLRLVASKTGPVDIMAKEQTLDQVRDLASAKLHSVQGVDDFLEETSVSKVVSQLKHSDHYDYVLHCVADGNEKAKRMNYVWMDETHRSILVTQEDVTESYLQQRKELEKQAKVRQQKQQIAGLEKTINSLPAGIAVVKKAENSLKIVMVNRSLCQLLKAQEKTLLSMPFDQLVKVGIYPDDYDTVMTGLARLFSDANATSYVYRTKEEGQDRYHWIRAEGRAFIEMDGSKTGYVIFTDASGEKQLEEEFARKIQGLSFNSANVLNIVHLNLTQNQCLEEQTLPQYASRVKGLTTADEYFTQCLRHLLGDEDRQRCQDILNRQSLLALFEVGKSEVSCDFRILDPQSHEARWVKAYLNTARNPMTGDTETSVSCVDSQDALLAEQIFGLITKAEFDYIAIVRLEGETMEMIYEKPTVGFPFTHQRVKYSQRADYVSKTFLDVEEQKYYSAMTNLQTVVGELYKKDSFTFSYRRTLADGSLSCIEAHYHWLNKEAGEILLLTTDVTATYLRQQKTVQQLQDALIEAEKASTAKSEFVSRISHDIRTPISIIKSMTDFATQDKNDPVKLSDDLKKIEVSNTFLLSLINDVLDVSKIDAGKIKLSPEPYSYQEFLSNVRNMLEPLCDQKHLKFTVKEDVNTKTILVDKTRLNQIVLNLLTNSVKYTPAGGSIFFASGTRPLNGRQVMGYLEIKDTGIGMSPDFQKVMFDPFTQEHDNPLRDRTATGTGLGLSIVKKLVDLMGGTITVKSALGKGSDFVVSFPLDKVDQNLAVSHTTPLDQVLSAKPLKGNILLVEDNEINVEIAKRFLAVLGLSVVTAENGKAALTTFEESKPHTYQAILMDIQMPIMNGYEATQAIRQLKREDATTIPIIAMTADAFSTAIEHAKQVGMNDYITKPIDVAKLRETLAHYLP